MSNPIITNVDSTNVIVEAGHFQDESLTFTAAATVKAGTILARDSSTLKLIPFVKGGSTNGNGVPKAVLTYEVTATAAGDIKIRSMVSGSVKKAKLVIQADGDNSNVDSAVMDQLRDYSMLAFDTTELGVLDNQ